MIIVDYLWHMTSTESSNELHEFAMKLGLKRSWYQTPGRGEEHAHYDLMGRMRQKAIYHGAILVKSSFLIKNSWWKKEE